MAAVATRHETSAGAVVFHRADGERRFLVIHDAHGNWGFPKGHVEKGESRLETARRELREETGIGDARSHGSLGQQQWWFQDWPQRVQKTCHYFLFEVDEMTAVPQTEEGISEVAWLSRPEAHDRLTFAHARDLLADAAGRSEATAAEGA